MPGAAGNVSVTQSLRRPGAEIERVAVQIDMRLPPLAVERDAQRNLQRRRALEEHVLGSAHGRLDAISVERNRHAQAALLETLARGTRREQEECALGAEQIGHAHRAQLGAVEPIRRKRDRHAQHRAPDAVLAENRPERLRLPQQPQLRLVQRNAVAAELAGTARPCRRGWRTAAAGTCADRDRGNRRCCGAPDARRC